MSERARVLVVLAVVAVALLTVSCREGEAYSRVESGGLGLLRSEWQQRYGEGMGLSLVDGRKVSIQFAGGRPNVPQRVNSIEVSLESLSDEEAVIVGMKFLPADATFLGHSSPFPYRGDVSVIDEFTSDALARLFNVACVSDQGSRDEPGRISLIRRRWKTADRPFQMAIYWNCPDR